jgi:hypothetical protein
MEVMQQLLKLHLDNNKAFGGNIKQDATWLNLQNVVVMSKVETDQKYHEDKVDPKRAVIEAERVEAAENHKLMADNSSKLV